MVSKLKNTRFLFDRAGVLVVRSKPSLFLQAKTWFMRNRPAQTVITCVLNVCKSDHPEE